jgi:hypothetical protein
VVSDAAAPADLFIEFDIGRSYAISSLRHQRGRRARSAHRPEIAQVRDQLLSTNAGNVICDLRQVKVWMEGVDRLYGLESVTFTE